MHHSRMRLCRTSLPPESRPGATPTPFSIMTRLSKGARDEAGTFKAERIPSACRRAFSPKPPLPETVSTRPVAYDQQRADVAHPAAPVWPGSVYVDRTRPLGVEQFGQTGTIAELYAHNGIDTDAIMRAAGKMSLGKPGYSSHRAGYSITSSGHTAHRGNGHRTRQPSVINNPGLSVVRQLRTRQRVARRRSAHAGSMPIAIVFRLHRAICRKTISRSGRRRTPQIRVSSKCRLTKAPRKAVQAVHPRAIRQHITT